MGREIRKVPINWEHPKDSNGRYIPLFGDNFSKRLSDWEEGKQQWDKGFRESFNSNSGPKKWQKKEKDELRYTYEEWDGEKPLKEDYMPEWKEEEKTHIQLYESTSEGTPISPVFKSDEFEKLCEWASKNANTFANYTASKKEWMDMLKNDMVHVSV